MNEENEVVQTASVDLSDKKAGRSGSAVRRYFERHCTDAKQWSWVDWACFFMLFLLLVITKVNILSSTSCYEQNNPSLLKC